LTNNGNQGTGIAHGELPSGAEWSVETAAKWVGGTYATIALYVNVTSHRYKFWLDGYYSSFEFDRDDDLVWRQTISQLQPQRSYTMKMQKDGSIIELSLDGKGVFAYQETDPNPGSLITLAIEPGRESTISFDYVLVTAQELAVSASTYGHSESSILLVTSQESTSSHIESLTSQTASVGSVFSLSITDIFTILGSLATLVGTGATLFLIARSRGTPKKKRASIVKDKTTDGKTRERTSDEKEGIHMNYEYDAFICHASEDKDEVARPLAEALTKMNLRVWYDEFTLRLGDSLRRAIDHGLANSRYGVVILSPSFFKKNWPQKELDGLAAREDGMEKVILPVWHRINRDDVVKVSPTLADKVAANTEEGLETVAKRIKEAMEPQISLETDRRRLRFYLELLEEELDGFVQSYRSFFQREPTDEEVAEAQRLLAMGPHVEEMDLKTINEHIAEVKEAIHAISELSSELDRWMEDAAADMSRPD
jgi:hypothetical protein